jgi:hypothetical protein
MKIEKNDVIRLNADADVILSYKPGSPPLKFIKNEMWMVDDMEEDPMGEGYILNISTFEPIGNINAGSYCSFVHSDDVKSIEKVYRIKKENFMKQFELEKLIENTIKRVLKEEVDLEQVVIEFLQQHPDGIIPDKLVHDLAGKLEVDPDRLESIFYKFAAMYVNSQSNKEE